MPTSIRQHADDIENLLDYLVHRELAIYRRPLRRSDMGVSWIPNSPGQRFLGSRAHHSADLYEAWVANGQYCVILADGALLQMTYNFEGRELVGHRLAYIPCPARVDPELLIEFPIADVVTAALDEGRQNINLATSVRFDFDIGSAGPGHPAAHLTINSADCRIPCVAPVRVGRFARFVFLHFYPEIWSSHRYLRDLPLKEMGPRTATPDEAEHSHLAWAV